MNLPKIKRPEQIHEKLFDGKNMTDFMLDDIAKNSIDTETEEETKRDEFVKEHREELEKVFHLDNPEITKDDFQEKFEEFISTSTLKDLSNLIK